MFCVHLTENDLMEEPVVMNKGIFRSLRDSIPYGGRPPVALYGEEGLFECTADRFEMTVEGKDLRSRFGCGDIFVLIGKADKKILRAYALQRG